MFKVMKGEPVDLAHLRYPVWVTPKVNGVRGYVGDKVYSTSNKPLPNIHLQKEFGHCAHHDGEFVAGPVTESQQSLNRTTSIVMSDDKPLPDDLKYYAFDHVAHPKEPFRERVARLEKEAYNRGHSRVIVLRNEVVHNEQQLLTVEAAYVELGYEGLITRDPDAQYKFGKSTAKQAWMGKLKRFSDSEGVVVGYKERLHNTNEATVNELGRTKRSSHAAGKIGMDMLGAIEVSWQGVKFSIGTGWTDAERIALWKTKESLPGRLAKFKYFEIGSEAVPVLPVFLGWRDVRDMS